MPSRRIDTFLTRFAAAQLGMLARDGSHIGHECSGILARGVTFGHPAASGIRRLGLHPRDSSVLRAPSFDAITATRSGD